MLAMEPRVKANIVAEAQTLGGQEAAKLPYAQTELASWLKKEAARGDQSHVLGLERYTKLLRVQEGLSLPLADFERMNEENLAANKKAYEELAAHVKDPPVREADLFAAAARLMKSAREFVFFRRVEYARSTYP